ncbi:MAG: riboflavin synthase [Candidatus Margulisiibacteriota bacterium]
MFTGLIQTLGAVTAVRPLENGRSVKIAAPLDWLSGLRVGDSVAVSGVCSTVVAIEEDRIAFDYLPETLAKTTVSELMPGARVNLEKSLSVGDKLGGHWVSGHVDGMGSVISQRLEGPFAVLTVRFDPAFAPFVISKGSVTIEGVSLTVVDVTADTLSVHLIPHTLGITTLQDLREGSRVNLEFDVMAKYLFRFFQLQNREEKDGR